MLCGLKCILKKTVGRRDMPNMHESGNTFGRHCTLFRTSTGGQLVNTNEKVGATD